MKVRWLAYIVALVLLSGTWLYSQSLPSTGSTIPTEVTATNLDVQSGGSDLVTEATLSTFSTSFDTVFGTDAIFGTAGSADADVLTVQGVTSMTPILSQPFDAIKESGSTEMVGKDFAAMVQNTLSAGKEIALGGTYSGEVVQACLTQSEENVGAILADIALRLFIFDADPSITTADTLIATASHALLLDEVAFANGSFWIDTGAATLCMPMNTLFHATTSLWFSVATEGATAVNSGATDDEVIDLNFWYRRDS